MESSVSTGKLLSAFLIALGYTAFGLGESRAQTVLTAGKIALLAEPNADRAALRDAILHADPAVRGVAARLAGLLNRRDLTGAMTDALNREQDPIAGREQVRALLYLDGVANVQQVGTAATRLGAPAVLVFGEWLARNRIEEFATAIPDLGRQLPTADIAGLGQIAAMAIRQTPASRDRVTSALAAAGSSLAWRAYLSDPRLDVNEAVLTQGLAAPSATVRNATIWFIVSDERARALPADQLRIALNPTGSPLPADDGEWTIFGRELLARRLGKSEGTDGSQIIKRYAAVNAQDARKIAELPELTAMERSALREAIPDLARSQTDRRKDAATGGASLPARLNPRVRTFPAIAPGFLESLAAAVECVPPSSATAGGAAQMTYHRDGRPRAIALDTTTLREPCARFTKLLAMLTVAPPDEEVVEDQPQVLYLAMDKEAIRCIDEDMLATGPTTNSTSKHIRPPKKIKDVRPVYPESMRAAGIQGLVVIESIVTRKGCVADAQIRRTAGLLLDLAGLRAVSLWRFDPTLVDGAPVPVSMTVTVNFTLK